MRDRPELTALVQKAIAAFNAMTPEEQSAMHKAQRESWARGEAALEKMGRETRGMSSTDLARQFNSLTAAEVSEMIARHLMPTAPCCDCRERVDKLRAALQKIEANANGGVVSRCQAFAALAEDDLAAKGGG